MRRAVILLGFAVLAILGLIDSGFPENIEAVPPPQIAFASEVQITEVPESEDIPNVGLTQPGFVIPFEDMHTIGPVSLYGMCNVLSHEFFTESLMELDRTVYKELEWSGGTKPILAPVLEKQEFTYWEYPEEGIWLEFEVTKARISLDMQGGRLFAVLSLPNGKEQYVQLYRGQCARYLWQSSADALRYQLQDGPGVVKIQRVNLAFTIEGELTDPGYWVIPFIP